MRRTVLATCLLVGLCGCIAPPPVEQRSAEASQSALGEEERRLFLTMVRELYRHDRTQAALAFLEDYDRRYPKDPEAWMLRGHVLLKTGDVAGARQVFQELRDEGRVPMADFGLGKAAAANKGWEDAARHFADAVELAPSNPRYLNNLGYALLQLGRPNDAYAALAKAFDLDRANVATRNNFLLAAHRIERRDRVERVLSSLDPAEHQEVRAMIEGWRPDTDIGQPDDEEF